MTTPSTIRRQALEEVRAVLPRLSTPTMDSVWSGGWNSCVQWVEAKLNALLAADPREASEPSLSADRVHAPADHGPEAAANGETGTNTYHDGVRDALAALAMSCNGISKDDASLNLQGVLDDLMGQHNPHDGGVCARTIRRVIDQLEAARALLPQPKDEAEEIQRAFERHCAETGCRFDMLEGWRWLLSQGWRAPE